MSAFSTHVNISFDFLHFNNTADVDNMSKILADNFTSTIKPATLGIPVLGKQPFLDRLKAAGIRYGVSLQSYFNLILADESVSVDRVAQC